MKTDLISRGKLFNALSKSGATAKVLGIINDMPTENAITKDKLPYYKGSTDLTGSSWESGYAAGYNSCLDDLKKLYDE